MFFPRRVAVKTLDGREVDFSTWRKKNVPASSVVENDTPPSHQTHWRNTSVVRTKTTEAEKKTSGKLNEKLNEKKARKVEEKEKAAEERRWKEGAEQAEASTSAFKPSTPGNFSAPTSKMTSEERFVMSWRSASDMPTSPSIPLGRPGQVTHASGRGDPGSDCTGGRRDCEHNRPNKVHAEDVSDNQASPIDEEQDVERKVKILLGKLTTHEFDSISDQIIEWANKSEAEKDDRTLIDIARLVFEKATDDAARSEVYARLCRKIMEAISPDVQDDGIRNLNGKTITGGQLFRKYLVSHCQEDFERSLGAVASAAPTKTSKGSAVKKFAGTPSEVGFYSDECYAAQKAKQRGLGLVQFISELYKLQMLTERIIHECIKKLIGNIDNPEEGGIEWLCRLLTTVGKLLDSPKARAYMDIYFTRIKELEKSSGITPRIKFMLLVSSLVYIHQPLLYTLRLGSYRAT